MTRALLKPAELNPISACVATTRNTQILCNCDAIFVHTASALGANAVTIMRSPQRPSESELNTLTLTVSEAVVHLSETRPERHVMLAWLGGFLSCPQYHGAGRKFFNETVSTVVIVFTKLCHEPATSLKHICRL